jgi:hypothetical protein
VRLNWGRLLCGVWIDQCRVDSDREWVFNTLTEWIDVEGYNRDIEREINQSIDVDILMVRVERCE